jgi:hypothetical protein
MKRFILYGLRYHPEYNGPRPGLISVLAKHKSAAIEAAEAVVGTVFASGYVDEFDEDLWKALSRSETTCIYVE